MAGIRKALAALDRPFLLAQMGSENLVWVHFWHGRFSAWDSLVKSSDYCLFEGLVMSGCSYSHKSAQKS